MGDRGVLTDEPVDRAAAIAAELVDALSMAVSSLGLCDRSGSSPDEPVPAPATASPAVGEPVPAPATASPAVDEPVPAPATASPAVGSCSS